MAAFVAIAASTAFPPALRISTPMRTACGCDVATMPLVATDSGRPKVKGGGGSAAMAGEFGMERRRPIVIDTAIFERVANMVEAPIGMALRVGYASTPGIALAVP